MSGIVPSRRWGSPALQRVAWIALAVTAIDLGTKMIAVAGLGTREIPLAGGTFLAVVYNESFARGLALGEYTLFATLALALFVLAVLVRVCTPLTLVDQDAPLALGLVAGATVANAADYVRTGHGVVDFLGVATSGGVGVVFNLADVAAYVGVALMARTAFRLSTAIVAERRLVVARRVGVEAETPLARRRESHIEVPVRLPVMVDGLAVRRADEAPGPIGQEPFGDVMPRIEVPADSAARHARGLDGAATAPPAAAPSVAVPPAASR